jgi:hypothetical protein
MMELRSDSDIVKKTLTLKFGGKEYEIPVLRMLAATKWRKEYFKRVEAIRSGMIVEDQKDNPSLTSTEIKQAIGNALAGALLAHAEAIPEIVFSYAPDLPRAEIEEIAYDQEFRLAFEQIWQVAFAPFLASMGLALEMSKASASQSVSSANLN